MAEEKFVFTAKARKNLFIFITVGLVLMAVGIAMLAFGGGGHHGAEEAAGEHGFHWIKRIYANLWINNMYFLGLALIGVLFFAIQYAAQAGWSAGILRIPLSFGAWLPVAGILTLLLFLVAGLDIFHTHQSLFHWTHEDLYDPNTGDPIVQGKQGYFFWPLEGGTFPLFYVARMVIFFGVWYWLFGKLKKVAYSEDLEAGTDKWFKMRKLSAIFIVFFAVSSSISAWDWVMSIDVHWFSTMMGWYVFASWWVAGLAFITFVVVLLKDAGYLAVVNSNHLHDLGKFMFAFSIFWTYIWFSQFFLIYYANIPEETIYYVERWKNSHYAPVFYLNLIANFFLPFLILMTRDSKRHSRILKVAAPMIIIGHWLDFYLMITPATLGEHGGFGLIELGIMFVYFGAFVFVMLNRLSKAPLVAKNHPMLQESLHHHI